MADASPPSVTADASLDEHVSSSPVGAIIGTPTSTSQERPRPRRRVAGIAAGVAISYLGVRALGALVLAGMIDANPGRYTRNIPLLDALQQWDAAWFLGIAKYGYAPAGVTYPDGSHGIRNIAFLPGYPGLIRLAHNVVGLSNLGSALLVTALAGIVAAIALYFLVERLHGGVAAGVVVILWAAQPMSIVLSMAYSEALFAALAFSALLAAHRCRWVWAGVLGLAAGLVRAEGLALAGALVLYAGWWSWRHRELGEDGQLHRVRRGKMVLALGGSAVALVGTPLYIVIVGQRFHHVTAWFDQQRAGWQSQWDWGRSTPTQIWHELSTTNDMFPVMCAVIVIVAVVLLVVAALQRVWPGLIFFGVLTVAQTVGSSVPLQSKPRLLLPAVTLLVPVAVAIARARPAVRVLALLPIVAFGLWFGAESLTVWQYGI